METHISWVFLTGDRVYKVKKPVVFPFLDYGTAERRRRLCEEEVRLNRRLAPDLYLGVRGLARAGGHWEVVDSDDPRAEEWAVEMRRFDERRTLASLLAAGEVGGEQVTEVGHLIAGFHRDARVVHGSGSRVEAARRATGDNFETLAAHPNAVPARDVAAARRFTDAFLAGRGADLEERRRRRMVRDCHGDLRAEHVVLEQRIEIFDCIEFSEHLREIDVAADLAFLVMDLVHRDHGELADALVDAYREAGGDPGDGALLAFFAAYRAWVRAKVACLRADELGAGDDRRPAALEEAASYAATAHRFAWRAREPLVLVLCGVSASGKSFLASHLGEVSGWDVVNSDVIRKELLGLAPGERAPQDAYTDEMSIRTYAELGKRARALVEQGRGVIVDATFRLGRDREAFERALGASPPRLVVRCEAPPEVLAERARRRASEPQRVSDAGVEQVIRQQREFAPFDEPIAELRTDRPLEQVADELEAILDERVAEGVPR